jgi:hypothetical protein
MGPVTDSALALIIDRMRGWDQEGCARLRLDREV